MFRRSVLAVAALAAACATPSATTRAEGPTDAPPTGAAQPPAPLTAKAAPPPADPKAKPKEPPRPPSPLELKLREEILRDKPLDPEPGSHLAELGQRSFLFVAGFLNELIPGYFDDNRQVVKELGATASQMEPSSRTSMSDEADEVKRALLEVHQAEGRKVVLVGHSMGGAAVLLCALRYPELVKDGTLDAVIVLQGAVGGSPLADGISHVPFSPIAGIHSITRNEAHALFQSELQALEKKTTEAERKDLFSRIFYVRSSDKERVVAELALGHAVLDLFGSGQSDGLMLEEDMKLPVGVDLGVLEADHADLTVSSFLSNSTPRQRRAFTRALLREVAKHRGD